MQEPVLFDVGAQLDFERKVGVLIVEREVELQKEFGWRLR